MILNWKDLNQNTNHKIQIQNTNQASPILNWKDSNQNTKKSNPSHWLSLWWMLTGTNRAEGELSTVEKYQSLSAQQSHSSVVKAKQSLIPHLSKLSFPIHYSCQHHYQSIYHRWGEKQEIGRPLPQSETCFNLICLLFSSFNWHLYDRHHCCLTICGYFGWVWLNQNQFERIRSKSKNNLIRQACTLYDKSSSSVWIRRAQEIKV